MGAVAFSALGCERKVVVGVGGLAVSNDRSLTLTTYSLGSCLGITLYDPVARAGGLLHAMLPDSNINPAKASQQPGMFVDSGLPALFRALYQLHANKHRIQICVAGGARLMDDSGFFNIGERNFAAVQEILGKHNLTIEATQIGGLTSRTLSLSVDNGEVRVKGPGRPGETILFSA